MGGRPKAPYVIARAQGNKCTTHVHPVRTRGEDKEKPRRWTFLECLQLTLSQAVPQLLFFISCSSLKLGTIVYSLEQAIPNLSSQAEIKLAVCPRALRPAELAYCSSFNYQFGQKISGPLPQP